MVQSLIDKMLEENTSGELPPLLKASSEAGGHLLVLMLGRSLYQDPQLSDQSERVMNLLKSHSQNNNMRENPFCCIIFAALQDLLY